jgi:hypothetical protein
MQSMFKLFHSNRPEPRDATLVEDHRPQPRDATVVEDPRPYRRRPAPQPRMRWY